MKLFKYLAYTIFLTICLISFYAFFYELPPPSINKIEQIKLENES